MPRRRYIDPFFIVVFDSDRKLFNVLGPMDDDTRITHDVCIAQEKGQSVNCSTAGLGQSKQQIIDTHEQMGLRYTDERIVDSRLD